MNPMAIYLANPDVKCNLDEPEGSAVLLNPDTDAILGINSTSLLLWQALRQPRTRDQLAAYLLKHCTEEPVGQVTADVEW